jgi:hypothetical protein
VSRRRRHRTSRRTQSGLCTLGRSQRAARRTPCRSGGLHDCHDRTTGRRCRPGSPRLTGARWCRRSFAGGRLACQRRAATREGRSSSSAASSRGNSRRPPRAARIASARLRACPTAMRAALVAWYISSPSSPPTAGAIATSVYRLLAGSRWTLQRTRVSFQRKRNPGPYVSTRIGQDDGRHAALPERSPRTDALGTPRAGCRFLHGHPHLRGDRVDRPHQEHRRDDGRREDRRAP